MHSIVTSTRSLGVGDLFVTNPDSYFFAMRYRVDSVDEDGLNATSVNRYPNMNPNTSKIRILFKDQDTIYTENPDWSAFPPNKSGLATYGEIQR